MEGERLHWVDAAKASAVVLVVVYHASFAGLANLTAGSNSADAFLKVASTWLLPVRMPLFFLVSGFLSVDALSRQWGDLARPRIANHLWVFGLWTLLYAFPYAAAYHPAEVRVWTARAASWTISLNGAYWYLPLLVLFFVVSRIGRGLPYLMLSLAIVGYAAWPSVPLLGEGVVFDGFVTVRRALNFYLFFAIGAFARPMVERWARAPWWMLPASAFVYVPAALALYGPEPSDFRSVLTPLLSAAGITFFLTASRLVTRWPSARTAATYLARRTLPIYLLHSLVLALIIWFTGGFRPTGDLVSVGVAVGLTLTLTAASCLLYDATRPILPWLYQAPRRGRRGSPERAPLG